MQLWVNRYKRTPPPLPPKQELFLEVFFAVGISNASCYFLGVFLPQGSIMKRILQEKLIFKSVGR